MNFSDVFSVSPRLRPLLGPENTPLRLLCQNISFLVVDFAPVLIIQGVELYKNYAIMFLGNSINERRSQDSSLILSRRNEKGDTLSPYLILGTVLIFWLKLPAPAYPAGSGTGHVLPITIRYKLFYSSLHFCPVSTLRLSGLRSGQRLRVDPERHFFSPFKPGVRSRRRGQGQTPCLHPTDGLSIPLPWHDGEGKPDFKEGSFWFEK